MQKLVMFWIVLLLGGVFLVWGGGFAELEFDLVSFLVLGGFFVKIKMLKKYFLSICVSGWKKYYTWSWGLDKYFKSDLKSSCIFEAGFESNQPLWIWIVICWKDEELCRL